MVMKYVMVAPVGDNIEALFVGMWSFPTEKLILLAPEDRAKEAKKLAKDLNRLRIPYKIIPLKGVVWEELFAKIGEIARFEKPNSIIINTSTGDRITTCAATCAAFVNGLKAISVEGDEAMLLPVLKFSYYRLLTDKKLNILKHLCSRKEGLTFEALRKTTKMSPPLLSYHINGNLKSEGLVDLGLVDVSDEGKVKVKLTMMGRMLVRGSITREDQENLPLKACI